MNLDLFHIVSERRKCQAGQLEMLHAEGNADDGDTKQKSPKEVGQENPETSDKKPDDVHHCGQAPMR